LRHTRIFRRKMKNCRTISLKARTRLSEEYQK